MEFHVKLNHKTDTPVTSQVMTMDSYNFYLKVYPNGGRLGKEGYLGMVVFFSQKKANDFPLGSKIVSSVELVNHRDPAKSITKEYSGFCYPGGKVGWRNFVKGVELFRRRGWFNAKGKLVFRASASVVKEDPNPLKPNEHEVRFNGREEYDIGDEFKSPPTWKGNYKFQVIVYPGGAKANARNNGLSAYVNLLGQRDNQPLGKLKLSIKLINHDDAAKTIRWTSVHTFTNEDRTWGCPSLIPIDQLRNETLGWTNGSGELVLRVYISPALPEGPAPQPA